MNKKNILRAGAIAVIAAALSLSAWQFERAEQKRQLEQTARDGLSAPPLSIAAAPQTPLPSFRRANVRGEYLPELTILLDNRTREGVAGYYVVTPLLLADGAAVAVNRGWLPAGRNRKPPPTPPLPPRGEVLIRGALADDETGAFALTEQNRDGVVWQRLFLHDYAAVINVTLLNKILVRAGDDDGDELTPPPPLRVSYRSQRSTGYAFQWLSLALLAGVFYVVLTKRGRK